MMDRTAAKELIERITLPFSQRVRIVEPSVACLYVQILIDAPCSYTGESKEWSWDVFISSAHLERMTEATLLRYLFTASLNNLVHELQEGFQVDGERPYDPHEHGDLETEVAWKETMP